ncbi:NAD(P)-binding protein [Coniochaeta ligniaria NRRL 30616]|uniref:NAD(P)-binding protein n=1 Tax=Coniochaeta ligniaria NRRL 30616 TaxID=1408157 RepID=A0A1J7J029_9PEZI|nr:NAD(P)-binding protein [Coniochaeta ligniaria NRRL 30616]
MSPSKSQPGDNLGFNCALVTGGGGGIGKAISQYLISKGKKVIIAGRTESKLRETAKEIGAAAYYVLDTGKVAEIPRFIEGITKEHPELDCLVNNAGVQRPLKILEDQDFLTKADQEIDINIRGPMHLTLGLLPHFRSKKDGAIVINVSSVLGFIPFSVINPVYNGTKAWLHFWSMNLRTQLAQGGADNIRVIEIAPPTVATDLHRERENPDDNKKENNPDALSVDEFMEEVAAKLEKGDDTIGAGMSADVVKKWYDQFGEFYSNKAGGGK